MPQNLLLLIALFALPLSYLHAADDEEGWRPLFNGKDLTGWKANQEPESFSVEDGTLKTHGINGMAHLYYFGEDMKTGEKFINFELKAEVLCKPNSNSGIFFHTTFHPTEHFLDYGYEAQVNNTHKNKNKTGGLFAVEDLTESPVKDDEWFEYYIKVEGKRILIKINGETTLDYTEPENAERNELRKGRLLNPEGGLIAVQAHDPGSVVYFRNIRIRELD